MRRNTGSLASSMGVFQDVIMSSTGILLMFVFVLILHISLSKYSASVEQAEQTRAVLAEVDARKELQAEVQAAQYRLQSLLAGEVAQFEELVSRRTKKYSEVPPVVTETETEDPPKPLLSDLDMEFYRNTAPVENPAVLMLRGGVLEFWPAESEDHSGTVEFGMKHFYIQFDAWQQGYPTSAWREMQTRAETNLDAAVSEHGETDGIILLITPSAFKTVDDHDATVMTLWELSKKHKMPFSYALVPESYTLQQ